MNLSKNEMTSNKPYLIRALYEWIADNNMTPHILIDTTRRNVQVPNNYIKDNQIVLNISGTAANQLLISNEAITFGARFGGVPMKVFAPMHSIMAIFARETSQGMTFDLNSEDDNDINDNNDPDNNNPVFTVV